MRWRLPGPLRKFEDDSVVVVSETETGLIAQSKVSHSRWGSVVTGVIFVLWSWIAYRSEWGWKGVAFGVVSFATYLWNWKDKVEVSLEVSDRGFESVGNFGGGYRPIRWVQWSEITSVAYGAGTGGEDEYSPEGLWAKGPRVSTCLLPGLRLEEAQALAERIYARFPDIVMAVDTEHRGLFRDGLISLNLSARD